MPTVVPVPSPESRRTFRRVLGLAAILAAVYTAVLWPRISHGTLWHHDELLTGNRAREIVVRHDPFTITLNFEPDFTKPPLQYWVSAALLRITSNRELAVRLPSLLYGALCLPATVFLAWCCRRRRDQQEEATTLILLLPAVAVAAFGYFVHLSRVGLLDTGTAFYLTLALAGCQLARHTPRWWWLVGAACILGALQKAPYAFTAWFLVLLLRRADRCESDAPRSGHLTLVLPASLLAAATWPALQWITHGNGLLVSAGHHQAATLLRAHDPEDTGFRPYLYWWWLIQDWAAVGVLAPLAAIGTLLSAQRRRSDPPQFELAAVCAALGLVLALTPYRAERYLITMIPPLAVLTLDWFAGFIRRFSWQHRTSFMMSGLVVMSAFPVAAFHYVKPARGGPATLHAAAADLRDSLQAGDVIVVDLYADLEFNAPDFIQFYAHLRRSAEVLRAWEIESLLAKAGTNHERTSYRGIVRADFVPTLQRVNANLQVVSEHGGWVLWRCAPAGE